MTFYKTFFSGELSLLFWGLSTNWKYFLSLIFYDLFYSISKIDFFDSETLDCVFSLGDDTIEADSCLSNSSWDFSYFFGVSFLLSIYFSFICFSISYFSVFSREFLFYSWFSFFARTEVVAYYLIVFFSDGCSLGGSESKTFSLFFI